MSETGAPTLACPLCRGTSFQEERSRDYSRRRVTSFAMTLKICRGCRYVLQFYDEDLLPYGSDRRGDDGAVL